MENKKLKLEDLQRPPIEAYKSLEKASIVIVLDNIRSAQNIGSVFRTADAFNIRELYLTGISAIPPNKEILKTALGSTASVAWQYRENIHHCVGELRDNGYLIISVEQTQSSTKLHRFIPLPDHQYAFIFGNEVEGVSQEIIDSSDDTVEIPQFGTKHSLNVAVSAGIILWDVYRKMYL